MKAVPSSCDVTCRMLKTAMLDSIIDDALSGPVLGIASPRTAPPKPGSTLNVNDSPYHGV